MVRRTAPERAAALSEAASDTGPGRTLVPHLKDGLARVLARRPACPVAFLAAYFTQLAQGRDAVHQAYHAICLADPPTNDHLFEAFMHLERAAGEGVSAEDHA